MLLSYERNYPLWFSSSQTTKIIPSCFGMIIARQISWKMKSFVRQVDFASWQYAFTHSTFSKAISCLKTNTSVGTFIILPWFGPMWFIHAPKTKKFVSQGLILNHLKTVRAMQWQYWKDYQKMISSNVSGHGDVRLCA